jgi:hypothetical protein
MSTTGSDPAGGRPQQPTEEELRAAYEAELKKIRVEHVLLEHVVTLVNLGMRRTGLAPGTESERDPAQVQLAIEAVRALLPMVEQVSPEQVGPIRDALSQLQLAFVRIGGESTTPAGPGGAEPGEDDGGSAVPPEGEGTDTPPGAPAKEPAPGAPGDAGPAQRSGRLWVPGQ